MTAITATPQPATDTVPPSMLLQVTGAPNPNTPAYSSNFSAGVDSWVAGTATISAVSSKLRVTKTAAVVSTAYTTSRVVSGLTVGVQYRYKVRATRLSGQCRLSISGGVTGSWVSPVGTAYVELLFTATATSHTIVLAVQTTSPAFDPDYRFDQITVTSTAAWLGTTIYRTDVNGVVVVREDQGGQDTSGGAMTVTDWEAALVGPVTYRVVDGLGAEASITTSHAITRRNQVKDPRLVTATGWAGVSAGGTITSTSPFGPAGVSAAPGEVWTLSLDLTAPAGSAMNGTIAPRPTAGGSFGALPFTTSAYSIPAGQTQRVTHTLTIPAGADGVRVYFTASVTGGDADRVLMAEEPSGGAYFDGDSADDGTTMRAWTGTANASASIETGVDDDLGAWLTLPATATPSGGAAGVPNAVRLPLVTDYTADAASVGQMHQVIGRADKIGNPGVLSTRAGTLTVWEPDYTAVKALRDILAGGLVALFRQPTLPGMDAYLVASRVGEAPQPEITSPRRWGVQIQFDEVSAP